MKHICLFEQFNSDLKQLIHITTPEIAKKIQRDGFKPIPFIDYKYYSDFGRNGIYFYDNKRQSQFYAYHLANKSKNDKVAIIYAFAPIDIIQKNDKLEDGYFIQNKDLSKIKISKIDVLSPTNIY